jgi:hypothetical protein
VEVQPDEGVSEGVLAESLSACGSKMRRNADNGPDLGKSFFRIVFPTKHFVQWIDPPPLSAHSQLYVFSAIVTAI